MFPWVPKLWAMGPSFGGHPMMAMGNRIGWMLHFVKMLDFLAIPYIIEILINGYTKG